MSSSENPTSFRGTIASVLTPSGLGAIASVGIRGEAAAQVVSQFFERPGNAARRPLAVGQLAFGWWRHRCGGSEELVVTRFAADDFEIHCHGGDVSVGSVIDCLSQAGIEIVAWQEWFRRTEPDPLVVEARLALAEVNTARAAAILLDQLRGSLRRAILSIVADLSQGRVSGALHGLEALHGWVPLGAHLCQPWKVALVGAPNVGKSSLINAIVGFQRSLVDSVPGTTRDVVTAITAIGGWPVELADTAGLRNTSDDVERQGVQRAHNQLASADLVLWVHDASQARSTIEMNSSPAPERYLSIWNKIDLRVPSASPDGSPDADGPSQVIRTSAITGAGIPELLAAIEHALVPVTPPEGTAVPFTRRQVEAIERAIEAIQQENVVGALSSLQDLLIHH